MMAAPLVAAAAGFMFLWSSHKNFLLNQLIKNFYPARIPIYRDESKGNFFDDESKNEFPDYLIK